MKKNSNIIKKLHDYNLLGRGGAGFPTAVKWESVLKAKASKKFVVCNASEGEPGVMKDHYLLEKYPDVVICGMKIAIETLHAERGFIYLNHTSFKKLKNKLKRSIGSLPITLIQKYGGYVAGEETVVCEVIEGKRAEPRLKPPLPVQSGLWGCPTLVNNVETFYYVGKIANNEYQNMRYYSITGDCKKSGLYELPVDMSIEKILTTTGNMPKFDFFIQMGGGAIGEIMVPKELDRSCGGAGAIVVYNRKKTDTKKLMHQWANFFVSASCGKCLPCREGVFQLVNELQKKTPDKKILEEILYTLEVSSFCAMGKSIPLAFTSLMNKVIYAKE